MNLKSAEIAKIVSGKLEGNDGETITGISGLAEAQKGDISFLTNMKYVGEVSKTNASVILVSEDIDSALFSGKTIIKVQNPQYAYGIILKIVEKERLGSLEVKIHASASVSEKSKIGKNAYIGQNAVIEDGCEIGDNVKIFPNVYIGKNVKIGNDCIFYPNVVIREDVTIGDRTVFQPGAVIGGDGFGFAVVDGKTQKIPQIGRIEIGDDVEIGANTAVDKAAVNVTKIGSGTKIDNLVQIAHNVYIGENCIIVAQTGIAGSTKIGNNTTVGAQVGISGHIKIGNNVIISSQSGVGGDVHDAERVGGNPLAELGQSIKIRATMRKLPEMYQDIKKIKQKLEIPK
ncbi:MAG: UDP-3-O-(3-hydroxymyristoyl)glucosamine N-acyltransferase [Endomicrobium sp.]|jgi:UDP-3-O-[3-hydroxymyristoyl] glucosamine N-acyltransferase|nr:UDP-3-O-(3-hydroxymyristoyl)glucosamine N-acyltransferase [Endomicrobium sp.]